MYLFAKNAVGNISDNQLITFREFARIWLVATDEAIDAAVTSGMFVEVKGGKSSGKAIDGSPGKAKGRKAGKSARRQ